MPDLHWKNGRCEIVLHRGDITRLKVDAIVNAANSRLAGGGGVDGAIHRAGGSAIMEECRAAIARIGRLETGSAVATTAGLLSARCVIHTVGPIYAAAHAQEQAGQLAECYCSSLRAAAERGCASAAFPSISTGVYGYPIEQAAATAADAVLGELPRLPGITQVIFCVFSEGDCEVYRRTLEAKLGTGSERG